MGENQVMDIKHVKNGSRGGFIIKGETGRFAEMTYSREGDSSMNIDHTQVDESLRGEGVAEKLLDAAVEFARENGLQVTATCPYAKKKLERNEDYADVYAGNE